jgi:hypothetical protein
MFNNGKIFTGPAKAKKHHNFAYYVMQWFCLIIEVLLGLNVAFLVNENLQIILHHMMQGVFLGIVATVVAGLLSLAVAACFTLGGMWTFAGFLDSYKDAEAYEQAEATWGPWPRGLMILLLLMMMALDFFTLQFRATYFAQQGEAALFNFFVVLIALPFVLGCIIHVIENTPRNRRQTKAFNYAQQVAVGDEERAVQYMTPQERDQYLSGYRDDALASYHSRINDQRDAGYQAEQDRKTGKQMKLAEKAETRERNRNPFLKAVPTQADENGRSA